jgi:sec-independent protein translocase protein TatA
MISYTILLGFVGPWQWIIIGLAILLLFGGKKLPELMKGLGTGIKEFKNATGTGIKEFKNATASEEDEEKKKKEKEKE